MKVVTLTWAELQQAAIIGCNRRIRALRNGLGEPHGTPPADLWGNDIASTAAEMAAAKALDVYWSDNGGPKPRDVGAYEVRSTTRNDGGLILYPADADESVFVLVIGVPPTFRMMGWMLGQDGKIDRYWETTRLRRPAFLVPQDNLHSFDDLAWLA